MWPPALSLCQHRATIQIPQALLEVTIPAFLFLLFCKIIPLGSLHPLLSPTGLPDLVSRAEPACCERSPPGWGPRQPSAAGEDAPAAALSPGTPVTSPQCWGGGREGVVSPASRVIPGLAPDGSRTACGRVPARQGPRRPGAALGALGPRGFSLPGWHAAVRAGVSSDPALAGSPPGSRNSWDQVTAIPQLRKQQPRSRHTSPGCSL